MTHQAAAIFVARQHSANLPLCYAGIPSSVASLSILLLPPMIYLVFSAMVGLSTNKPTTAENTSTSTFIQKPEAATAV